MHEARRRTKQGSAGTHLQKPSVHTKPSVQHWLSAEQPNMASATHCKQAKDREGTLGEFKQRACTGRVVQHAAFGAWCKLRATYRFAHPGVVLYGATLAVQRRRSGAAICLVDARALSLDAVARPASTAQETQGQPCCLAGKQAASSAGGLAASRCRPLGLCFLPPPSPCVPPDRARQGSEHAGTYPFLHWKPLMLGSHTRSGKPQQLSFFAGTQPNCASPTHCGRGGRQRSEGERAGARRRGTRRA